MRPMKYVHLSFIAITDYINHPNSSFISPHSALATVVRSPKSFSTRIITNGNAALA